MRQFYKSFDQLGALKVFQNFPKTIQKVIQNHRLSRNSSTARNNTATDQQQI
jgi:hypothetical protein